MSPAVLMLLVMISHVKTFNFDLRYPHVFHSPSPGDYFGFSVALHPGDSKTPMDEPWIMVGAPRSSNPVVPQAKSPGRVLKCSLNQSCTTLNLDPSGEPREHLDGSMLGAAQDMLGGRYVSCAPRWKDTRSKEQYTMLGIGYWGVSEDAVTSPAEKLLPLNDKDLLFQELYSQSGRKDTYPIYVYGEAGFSAHFPNKTQLERKELVLGAPGAYNWIGTTILYRDSEFSSGMARRRKRGVGIEAFAEGPIIPTAFSTLSHPSPLKAFGLFGYSVSSGRFFSRSQILHVAGAPRSTHVGQVIVYTFPEANIRQPIKQFVQLSGSQTGEYFGSSMTSCDVNNDGLDDLIVGAPLHSIIQEEGRVAIFLGGHSDTFTPNLVRELKGSVPNGRFGYAVTCLGDLDRDNYRDVAISAPYEGDGVVYIYNGGPQGLSATFSQRISGTDVFPGVSGFGFSLSRGQDMDGNGYADLAVGAYRSGHTFLFRSRPVIDLEVDFRPLIAGGLPRNSSEIRLEACVKYIGADLPQEIEMVQRVHLDTRLRRVSMIGLPADVTIQESLVTLHARTSIHGNFNCRIIQVIVKPNVHNFLEPISLSLEYVLPREETENIPIYYGWQNYGQEEQVSDYFCKGCPVLKRNSNKMANTQVLFVTDCGDDNVCNSQLSIKIQYLNMTEDSTFIVGSSPFLRVLVSVSNARGSDPAYLTRAELTVPVRPARLPSQCQEVANENNTAGIFFLSCDIANPLNPGVARHLEIELDMEGVSAVQGNLRVVGKAFTSSKDQEGQQNEAIVALQLIAKADITISGKSENELYYFKTKDEEETPLNKKLVPFKLRYQVEKFGFSPVHEVQFTVKFPVTFKSGNKFIQIRRQPLLTLNSVPVETCTLSGEKPLQLPDDVTETKRRRKREVDEKEVSFPANRTMHINCSDGEWGCAELTCRVGPFSDTKTVATLDLFLVLDVPALDSLLGLRDIIVYGSEAVVTKMDAHIIQPDGDKPDRAMVTAAFLGQIPEGVVAGWVIAVAVMVGILLLIAIITGLVKAGFFERKDKAALSVLRKEGPQYGSTNPTTVTDEK